MNEAQVVGMSEQLPEGLFLRASFLFVGLTSLLVQARPCHSIGVLASRVLWLDALLDRQVSLALAARGMRLILMSRH